MKRESISRKAFTTVNYIFLFILSAACLLPIIHIFAISFSSSTAAAGGRVVLWPVEFTTYSYEFVAGRKDFWRAALRTLERIAIGVPLSMIMTVMIAYPLSKEITQFRMRTVYVWIFFFTMLFSGGLIPGYMLIQNLHMMDSIWALVLPIAVPVYNIVLMLNFFRGIPKELEEAAQIDGAGQWQTCFRIYVPCAKPSIATLSLFTFVGHWNSWFDGLIFSNFSKNYPLASYLQTVIVNRDMTLIGAGDLQALTSISDRTVRSAQIFMGLLPILLIYPFVQKHFVKGKRYRGRFCERLIDGTRYCMIYSVIRRKYYDKSQQPGKKEAVLTIAS